MKLNIGDKAPEFTLPNQFGNNHSLNDYLGKWVLIYFYPKDNTPGCTKEACAIRDNYSKYKNNDLVALGISKDSVSSHEKFANKFKLPFTLLSDEEKTVMKKYNAWKLKKFMGKEYMGTMRISYLIDPKGKIAKIYEKVKPAEHAKQVLEDLKNLQ